MREAGLVSCVGAGVRGLKLGSLGAFVCVIGAGRKIHCAGVLCFLHLEQIGWAWSHLILAFRHGSQAAMLPLRRRGTEGLEEAGPDMASDLWKGGYMETDV